MICAAAAHRLFMIVVILYDTRQHRLYNVITVSKVFKFNKHSFDIFLKNREKKLIAICRKKRVHNNHFYVINFHW